ncbi:TonB-dependent receptor [Lacinutrix sp.]|uniref:TonB-dependent receptor n=1 Tax=Lacinutrix sp. TaxID=1937692 RepID=UPI002626994D|nr:TonB-dependent receptor [Lacinutrix sp.]MDG1713895.1 TonB-dependent receptor [Lacinutrix sp.]
MKKINQIKKIFSVLFMMFTTIIFAQSTISGKVADQSGSGLPGVNVVISGTNQGASTDFDGNYSISNVENGTYNVIASYVGFTESTKSITIQGSNATVNFQLAQDASSLDEVVITGVLNPKSRIESSVSISSIGVEQIAQSAPRTSGEIFRNIPGVRAETSGGDGNGNYNVRGVPVSSGGTRYLQLQEDGLPIMLFGDTSFGNPDNYLRIDSNVARIEAIRGGSASTLASNAPAGIINVISKTGAVEGGSIASSFGLDYQSSRLDFEYGTPLANGLSYHIGGFIRNGEGPRAIGYQGNKGGQFKANLTKRFEKGYVRVYTKFLNDRSAMYMPMPMLLEGDDANPTYANLPGFDITTDTPHSSNLQQSAGTSAFDGQPVSNDVRNGNNPITKSLGAEFSFDLGNEWSFVGKARYSNNSGKWIAPFTANVGAVADVAATASGASGATGALVYSDGDREAFNPANGLAQILHVFDVTIDDMSNFFGDVKISKKIGDNVNVTAGMFTATQNTKTSWQWSSFLSEVKGDGNARMVDFDGYSRNGQYAYGTPVWGNCCQRKYNTVHSVNSPYVGVDIDITEKINFDGSVRFENVNVNGIIASGPTSQGNYDYNGDGVIQGIEQNVPIVSGADGQNIDQDYNFTSFSAGLNYKINNGSAVFARYSKGASGRASDRNGYDQFGKSSTNFDQVTQLELGFKKRFENASVYVTAFSSNTDEDAGSALNLTVGNEFKATGLELEGSYNINDFSVVGSVTYTDAEIIEDRASGTGANKGKTPQRQADFVYNLSPRYVFGNDKQHVLGLAILGTSKSFAFDSNDLIQPGFAYVNLLGSVGLTEGLSLSLNINNLFDTVGITEVNGIDGAAINGSDRYVRARSITGRSSSLALRYKF